MNIRMNHPLLAAWLGILGPLTSFAAFGNERHERGLEVMDHLSGGAGQPVLDALRQDYPFLADGVVGYALGDV